MRTYTLSHRKVVRNDKNGQKKVWESDTFYISYYENRKRIWIDTGLTDEEEAQVFYQQKIKELECGTVYLFLKSHHWLEETGNPLYVDSMKGNIKYHLNYAHSKKNVRYLQVILEEIKDPIGDCLFQSLNRKDVQAFKDRLAAMETYIDGHGREREITYTFRNNVISAFSTIWSYYLRTGKADVMVNPFLQVEKFNKTTPIKKKYIFTPEDYRDIFNRDIINGIVPQSYYPSNHDGTPKMMTREKWAEVTSDIWLDFFELIFLTGMRGSEAAALCVNSFPAGYDGYVLDINRAFKSGLRKKDVNSADSEVEVIGKPKTNEIRRIVLCDRARDIAQKYMEEKSGDDLLFTLPMKKGENKYSTYLLSQKRAQVFRLFINEMNLNLGLTEEDDKALSLHGARTSLNTNLLGLKQHDEWLIAYALGWTSHALTNTQRIHYTDYSIEDLAELAGSINKLYLKRDFTWSPKPKQKQASSRQANIARLLKRSQKKKWIERMFKEVSVAKRRFFEAEQAPEAIEEFLALSAEQREGKKREYFMGVIDIIQKLGMRYNRDKFDELERTYDWSWDRV